MFKDQKNNIWHPVPSVAKRRNIKGLEKFLRNKKAGQFEKTLVPMSIEQFNLEIDQSMKDSDEGRIILIVFKAIAEKRFRKI